MRPFYNALEAEDARGLMDDESWRNEVLESVDGTVWLKGRTLAAIKAWLSALSVPCHFSKFEAIQDCQVLIVWETRTVLLEVDSCDAGHLCIEVG